jgi:small multidrug resistance pump
MKYLLRFAAIYNLAASANMLFFYREGFETLGMAAPMPIWPVQLLGLLVGLFGVGYWMVSVRPAHNRDLLLLGFWSKLLGSLLAIYHWRLDNVPNQFLGLVVISDIVYLAPFWMILWHLKRQSRGDSIAAEGG